MAGKSAFLSSGYGYLGKLLEFIKHVEGTFEFQGKRGLSLETLQPKRASSSVQGKISYFSWSCGGKLRILLELCVDLGDLSCLLWDVRSPLALQGLPQDSLCIAAGMKGPQLELRRESQGFSPFLTSIAGPLQSWNRRVRPRLVLRNGTLLASRVVQGVTGHWSSCIWNLRLFPDDVTVVSGALRVVTSSSGLHSKRCPGIGTYLEWMGKSVSFGMWHDPRGFLPSFSVRTASS